MCPTQMLTIGWNGGSTRYYILSHWLYYILYAIRVVQNWVQKIVLKWHDMYDVAEWNGLIGVIDVNVWEVHFSITNQHLTHGILERFLGINLASLVFFFSMVIMTDHVSLQTLITSDYFMYKSNSS